MGGGFAGLAAAQALGRSVLNSKCTVTLLDAGTETAMIPALPDYAAGLLPREWITAPIQHLLPRHVAFAQTTVKQVRLQEHTIETTTGRRPFDYLIMAIGSAAPPPAQALKTIETYALTNLHDADTLKTAFETHLQQQEQPEIIISGAGYTGVELAICLARRARHDDIPLKIHLVEMKADIMTFLPPSQHKRVLSSIARHHIVLHTHCQIADVSAQQVALSDGCIVAHPLLCRAEGTCAPVPLAEEQGVATLGDGRAIVEPSLALAANPHVFLAGDTAAFSTPNGYLRKAVNFSYYAGAHAGRNVARCIAHRPVRPFHPIDLGWVIPLGDDSVGQALGGLPLLGKMGLRLHYLMCGYRNYSATNFLRLAGHAVRAGNNNPKHKRKEQP